MPTRIGRRARLGNDLGQGGEGGLTPQDVLVDLAKQALSVAKVAARHRKSLVGVNYYADKMATLRADATNAFSRIGGTNIGNNAALAEIISKVFDGNTSAKERAQAVRDLRFTLGTTFAEAPSASYVEDSGVFPLSKLSQTRRGYLISVGRQANGAYSAGWFDACAVMMRRLLESSIIEAFEANQLDSKIKDPSTNDFLQLTDLIRCSLAETTWNLPRTVKKELPSLRDLGHRSAHNRYYLATKSDIDKLANPFRETIEAFLHISKLL